MGGNDPYDREDYMETRLKTGNLVHSRAHMHGRDILTHFEQIIDVFTLPLDYKQIEI